ncbi:HU family DNA-binding protein [Fusobacterium varium]|jgi:nucleoid DNA-binding protein|uniref:HU family DNA-binding protein n=1 Tax=Fusobacterium TaxID=848 RepID=UPI001032C10D|nr:HU family DNA-binding protein [Fusobacterium ulcerans]
MTESGFIKFYKERNGIKSKKEAKEKIENFWKALLKAIDEDKKVTFKNWGVFEEKNVKPRKISIPKQPEKKYTQSKKIIKFRAGEGLIELVNKRGESSE